MIDVDVHKIETSLSSKQFGLLISVMFDRIDEFEPELGSAYLILEDTHNNFQYKRMYIEFSYDKTKKFGGIILYKLIMYNDEVCDLVLDNISLFHKSINTDQ